MATITDVKYDYFLPLVEMTLKNAQLYFKDGYALAPNNGICTFSCTQYIFDNHCCENINNCDKCHRTDNCTGTRSGGCAKSGKCKNPGEFVTYVDLNKDECTHTSGSFAVGFSAKYTCKSQAVGHCAKPNLVETCALGSNASCICVEDDDGICKLTKTEGYIENSWYPGDITIEYSFDFTNYNYTQWKSLNNFIIDIYTGTNQANLPNGLPDDIKTHVRDANMAYGPILDFYNQIYNTSYYATSGNNAFRNNDFLANTTRTDQWKNQLVTLMADDLKSRGVYPTGIPKTLEISILTLMKFPDARYDDKTGDYYLTLYFSRDQAAIVYKNPEKTVNYANELLRDSEWVMSYVSETISWHPDGLKFSRLKDGGHFKTYGIDLDSLSWFSVEGGYTSYAPPTVVTNYPNSILLAYSIDILVEHWSPRLILYYKILTGIDFSKDPDTCKKIAGTISEGESSRPLPIPVDCFQQNCQDHPEKCRDQLDKYCPYDYAPEGMVSLLQTRIGNYIASKRTKNCSCLSSKLPPASRPLSEAAKNASICFSHACDDDFRALYNLDDDKKCQSYCDLVWGWLATPNPEFGSQKPDDIEWVRYSKLCQKYNPYETKTFNSSVILGGSILSVLILIIILLQLKISKTKPTMSGIVMIVSVIFLIGMVTFWSYDLGGIQYCEDVVKSPGVNACVSKVTNIDIPIDFCNFTMACECITNNNCPGDCTCTNSACFPSTGKREYDTVKVKKINSKLLIFCIILTLLIPIFLTRIQQLTSFKIPTIVTILLTFLPLGYVAIDYMIPKTEFVALPCHSSNVQL